jgi:hypothetical protein
MSPTRFVSILAAGTVAASLLVPLAVSSGEPVPVERLRPDRPAFTYNGGLDEPGQFVLRDGDEWASIWQRIHARSHPVPPLPEIDCGKEMVVVAALGQKRTGGYSIRIKFAWQEGAATIVLVQEESPGVGCIVPQAFVSPVDIARLPASAGPVEFKVESTVRDCK